LTNNFIAVKGLAQVWPVCLPQQLLQLQLLRLTWLDTRTNNG